MTDIQNLVEIVTQDYRWVLTFALPGYRVLRTIWTQLRRLVFDNLRRAHSSDHEEGLKATSLIRPVRRHTILNPREIRSLRRVPVEHNLGVSRILNFCVWVRLARLRPSSPKPAFTIADWELNRASEAHVDTSEFTPGGFELSVSLHAGESPRHLVRSMRAGFRSWMRTVVICTPEDLVRQNRPLRCLVVGAPSFPQPRRQDMVVTLKSADPLMADRSHFQYRLPSTIPTNAIWLVQISDAHACSEDRHDAESTSRDPIRLESWHSRARRYLVYVLSLVLFIALSMDIVQQSPDAEQKDVEAGVEADSRGAGVESEQTNGDHDPETEEDGADQARSELVLLVEVLFLMLVFYGTAGMAIWDMWYWIFEQYESRSSKARERVLHAVRRRQPACDCRPVWTASTTRCLDDGDRVRNGMN